MNQELIQEARRLNKPALWARTNPYAQALGINFILQDDAILGQMDFQQFLVGDIGIPAIHGGTLSALLESTAIFSLLWNLEETTTPKTINLSVEFLRSGKPETTFARSEITRQGRRIANVRTTAWQSNKDKPIAIASAHFLLVPGP